MKTTITSCLVVTLALIALPASPQPVSSLAGQPAEARLQAPAESSGQTPAFRFEWSKNFEALEQALEQAPVDGYEVAFARPAYQLLILRRRGEQQPRQTYRALRDEKAIIQGLAGGACPIPGTLDVQDGRPYVIAATFDGAAACESMLLLTSRSNTMATEIEAGAKKGFRVVGLATHESGYAALLSRTAGPAADATAPEVVFVETKRQDTLQKELSGRMAAGYRITHVSGWTETVVSLERHTDAPPAEVRVLSTVKMRTFERELQATAALGFRYVPGSLHTVQRGNFGFGSSANEYSAVLEKAADGTSRSYLIVAAKRKDTLLREFDEAVATGWIPISMALGFSNQESLVLFEQPGSHTETSRVTRR
jgi:hypothetical protein